MERRVLVLAPRGRDAEVIQYALERRGHECVTCPDAAMLHHQLINGAGVALVTEEALNAQGLEHLAPWIARQAPWSDFPFLLLAAEGSLRETDRARLFEKLGNVVLLERPASIEMLARAVQSSLRARERQYEARHHLFKRAEAEKRLGTALTAGRLGWWELDIETRILHATNACKELYGRDVGADLTYADVLASIHADDRAATRQAFEAVIANKTDLIVEYRIDWPDGSTHWLESKGQATTTHGTTPARLMVVSLDVTDRRESAAQLRASQEALAQLNNTLESRIAQRTAALAAANDRLMKEINERERAQAALLQSQKMEALGQLTGGIAHDFNNLLNVIMGNAELISRISGDERVKKMALVAKRATERGAKLTGQLLAFSRKANLDLKQVDLVALVPGLTDLLTLSVGSSIRIEILVDTDSLSALVDSNQLELAILNLAINARDAMPEGGLLSIRLSEQASPDESLQPGRYAVVSVADTGTGIRPELLDKVFDPFFTTKPVGKGTGLGLSQVYGIARQAGGTARIRSQVDLGTTVEIWLPLQHTAQDASAASGPDGRLPRGDEKILVVEDDADVRALLVECLQMLGYRVTEAAGGKACLERLEADCPDLLIVDFSMPDMSGTEVIELVRAKCPTLPFILATGYAEFESANYAIDPGRILRKPFQIRDLARSVREALAPTPVSVTSTFI